jgi:WD40 repeat protein
MCSNPYNSIISLGHSGGKLTMWKPFSRKPLVTMLCHHGPITALAYHPSGNLVATAGLESLDEKVKIWDLRGKRNQQGGSKRKFLTQKKKPFLDNQREAEGAHRRKRKKRRVFWKLERICLMRVCSILIGSIIEFNSLLDLNLLTN